MIHGEDLNNKYVLSPARINLYLDGNLVGDIYNANTQTINNSGQTLGVTTRLEFQLAWDQAPTTPYGAPDLSKMRVTIDGASYPLAVADGGVWNNVNAYDLHEDGIPLKKFLVVCEFYQGPNGTAITFNVSAGVPNNPIGNVLPRANGEPQLHAFDLENIDKMREKILQAVASPSAVKIDYQDDAPYGLGSDTVGGADSGDYKDAFAISNQEGLGIKTYQSDLFNNWISTEWIDGTNGIAEITAVSTCLLYTSPSPRD